MFEKFLKKNVRVHQKDGFIKYGYLFEIEEGFLLLRFENGKLAMIHTDDITGVEEVDK